MGASNSKPQTVEMANTVPFQISRDVAERIEKTAKSNEMIAADTSNLAHSSGSVQLHCEKCKCSNAAMNRVPQNTASMGTQSDTGTATCTSTSCSLSTADAALSPCSSKSNQMVGVAVVPWEKRSIEVEEMQFDKALDRVNKLFGEPVKWAKECSGDISDMENRLSVCYRNFPNEPLNCAKLAKEYHSFVFTKQFDEMTKSETQKKDANSKESTPAADPDSGQNRGS